MKLGTGLISDQLGRNSSGHDSGYVQTYYSLGIIVTVLLCGAIVALTLGRLRGASQIGIVFSIIFLMFVAEFKEPYIFKYIYPSFVLSIPLMIPRHPNCQPKSIVSDPKP